LAPHLSKNKRKNARGEKELRSAHFMKSEESKRDWEGCRAKRRHFLLTDGEDTNLTDSPERRKGREVLQGKGSRICRGEGEGERRILGGHCRSFDSGRSEGEEDELVIMQRTSEQGNIIAG